MDKKKYPIGPEHYVLYEDIGQGVSALVRRSLCVPLNSVVAIKILDCERDNVDLNNISREAQTMNLIDHPNILKSLCSFVADHNLWVVMPYMAGGSCLHILKAAYPDGFEEVIIATVLREVLRGLDYLHQHGHIHRDVKAGNILIDANGAIKLGDFGVSACLFDSGDRQRMRNTFVGTPCWMAPEVMEQLHGYDCKADIWSFGITALELAHGHAPFSKYPPMKVLLMTLQNAPPGLDYERDKKFSKSFKQMTASCLVKDPSKRPSAKRLLKHSFFKQARSNDYIARKLLEGLPNLGDRMKALKKKEEDMLAQKKMPDGEKEELSQSEYKRGISDWNFNLEDVKAQASLINDDDMAFDKDQVGNASFSRIDSCSKLFLRQFSNMGPGSQLSDTEEDPIQCQVPALPVVDSSGNSSKVKGEKSDDDASIASSSHEHSTPQCCSPHKVEQFENNMAEGADADNGLKAVENGTLNHHHRRTISGANNQTGEVLISGEKPLKSLQSSEGGNSFHLTDNGPSTPKGSKTSPASSDVEDKARVPVVQQKGRFKVTSENVELEKVASAPVLHKSHSMQVIGQHPSAALSSPTDASAGNVLAAFAYPVLQSFLQTNINQRENILSLMKQISSGEIIANRTGEGTCTSASIAIAEKSMLEASHDREKELLQEITDLQSRLLGAQEEIQKMKMDNARINN